MRTGVPSLSRRARRSKPLLAFLGVGGAAQFAAMQAVAAQQHSTVCIMDFKQAIDQQP